MLIFDFDGVIVNSLDEITVTAHNVITGRLDMHLGAIDVNVVRAFKRNRFHVQRIGDVIPLMKWAIGRKAEDWDKILSLEEYEQLKQGVETPVDQRTRQFFETRQAFVEKDRTRWLDLNAPYPAVWNELKRIPTDRIVILTNKDRAAVHRLCKFFGSNLLDENVYSGDDGATKTENLNAIHERFRDAPYTFIDDSVRNLKELDRHFNTLEFKFLHLILAAWGYIGPEDESTAAAEGYDVFSQADLIAYLRSNMKAVKV